MHSNKKTKYNPRGMQDLTKNSKKGSETMTEAQERTLKLLKETYPHMTEREEYYLDATVMALAAVCRKREGLEPAGERTV